MKSFQIIQYITYLLPNDADIASFALSSTHLAKKILPAHSSIWRQRFNDLYGIPQEHTSAELKNEYQIRSIVLSQDISFKFGQNEEQTLWLEVLRDMLLEAFIDSPKDSLIAAKTLNQIRKTLIPLEFLSRPLSGCNNALSDPPSDLFCSVQLVSIICHCTSFGKYCKTIVDRFVVVSHSSCSGSGHVRLLPSQ